MKLNKLFKINQGHQITDFEIYSSAGDIPIYTGDNDIKGYWDKSIVQHEDLPCISYPTKAFAGNVFIQNKMFDANNTAVLIPREKWKNKINLEWFKYCLPRFFYEAMTSKEGVSYLNKDIVKNLEISLPEKKEQDLEIKYYYKLEKTKNLLYGMLKKYDKLLSKDLVISNKENTIPLNKIFSYVSRNDVLSEEGVYKNNPIDRASGIIKVLSGGTDEIDYGEIAINTPDIHFIKDRQILHLVTRGKAGRLTYLPKGTYATNTNAFILYLKEEELSNLGIHSEKDEEIFLKFLKFYLEPKFIELSSFADVAVFPLTEIMNNMVIPKFTFNESIKNIVNRFDDILRGYNYIKNIYSRLLDLTTKNIQK